jgi:beta-N-acetylglucosaminidase
VRRRFFALLFVAAFFFLSAATAFAAIDAYVIEDQEEVYKYLMRDLVESFNTDEILWNDFSDRMMRSGVLAVYDNGRNRYVSFSALVAAFNDGIDVIAYTEKSDATIVTAPEVVKVVGIKDKEIVFNEWVPPEIPDTSAALKAVNDAATLWAMQKALTDNAAALMLDIERYNKMHVFAREYLARKMLAGRAYDSAEAARNAYIEAADKTDATIKVKYTNYSHTLAQAVEAQMKRNPQTDLFDGSWRTADSNMVSWHVNPLNFNETNISAVRPTSNVNMREGPSTGFPVITTLNASTGPYFVLNEVKLEDDKTWYRVMTNLRVGWVHGDFVEKVSRRGEGIFQFLLLSEPAGIPVDEINEKILKGRGALEGMAEAFIEGGKQHNVNEIFLVALAMHETGRGTSTLANGIEWDGKDGVKTVYNMFGIGAVDEDPINKGAQYAYDRGWFTPEAAIIGGAQFTSLNYIHHSTYKQDTLYKMRWNPASPGSHQYATDIGWAAKQVKRIKELYEMCDTYVLRFDLPRYKK